MKTACVMLLMVMLVGAATVEGGHLRKRFLFKGIKSALHSVGNFFTKTYNSTKDAFNEVASHVNFDAAVQALIPYIRSNMTLTACNTACFGAAAIVLRRAAPLAGTACKPLCKGALAKLEEMAS